MGEQRGLDASGDHAVGNRFSQAIASFGPFAGCRRRGAVNMTPARRVGPGARAKCDTGQQQYGSEEMRAARSRRLRAFHSAASSHREVEPPLELPEEPGLPGAAELPDDPMPPPLEEFDDVPLAPEVSFAPRRSQPATVSPNAAINSSTFEVVRSDFIFFPFHKSGLGPRSLTMAFSISSWLFHKARPLLHLHAAFRRRNRLVETRWFDWPPGIFATRPKQA